MWHDNWHEDRPLQLKFGRRIIHDSASHSSENLSKFIVNNFWCWPPNRPDSFVVIQSKVCDDEFARCRLN